VPFWLVLELVPTKLPHYPMPVYPALALLIGHAVSHPVGARWRWLDAIVGIAWLGVALGLAALLVIAPMKYGSGASIPALASSLILFVLGVWIILGASTLSTPATLLAGVLLSILVVAPTLGVVIPSLDRVWLTRGAAAMVARASPPDGVPIVSVGYNEPSLVFALGTMTRLASPGQAAQAMATVPVTLALVESREEPAFRAALAKQGLVPRAIDAVAGIDYSNGHDMTLTLFASEPP
jgi:4-amino-4-deoxy-L-arabinose transferase-like glycosyltransferase